MWAEAGSKRTCDAIGHKASKIKRPKREKRHNYFFLAVLLLHWYGFQPPSPPLQPCPGTVCGCVWVYRGHICPSAPRTTQQMSTRCHTATHLLDVQPSRRILISCSVDPVPACAYSQYSAVKCSVAFVLQRVCTAEMQPALYHLTVSFTHWCMWSGYAHPCLVSHLWAFILHLLYITLRRFIACCVRHDNNSNQFLTRGTEMEKFILIYLTTVNLISFTSLCQPWVPH